MWQGADRLSLIVAKFGGTSMAGTERIRAVAGLVARQRARGAQVAVVVSAMAGDTDRLLGFHREAAPNGDAAEHDVVVSAGEQITAGLLAATLIGMGVPARSWLGWQLPVRTVGPHGRARITTVETGSLHAALATGEVAIVPGFQGLGEDGRVTTLGRGGSDTSAVALAAALGADRCDIYTDVDGVYTTDPRIVSRARKLTRVTYEEMLELASVGAKVLQTRSVGLAMTEGVRVQVLSSFTGADATPADELPGTLIVGDDELEGTTVERQLITGIAHDKNEALINLIDVPERPGSAAAIFRPLADAHINVDMIVQTPTRGDDLTDMMFTVPRIDLARTMELVEANRARTGYDRMTTNDHIAKVSVVGVGMRINAGVASTMFDTLAGRGINMLAISTSEIKVSVVIDEDETELAVRMLHTAYGLDA